MADVHIDQTPVLVLMFGMDGCPACEDSLPRFREIAARHPEVTAYAVDSMKVESAADRFKVRATPTTVLLSFGRQVERIEGSASGRRLEALFDHAERMAGTR